MLVDWGVSIRRACRALRFDTSIYRYKSRRADQAGLERPIKEIAETRARYGYRRVHVLLRREALDHKYEEGSKDLQRVRSAAEKQTSQTPCEGEAA